jgi:hypothetical protein
MKRNKVVPERGAPTITGMAGCKTGRSLRTEDSITWIYPHFSSIPTAASRVGREPIFATSRLRFPTGVLIRD